MKSEILKYSCGVNWHGFYVWQTKKNFAIDSNGFVQTSDDELAQK